MKGNKLFLYTQKTGTAVYVLLPPAAVKALGQLEGDGEHFFTSGKAKPQTARANWSRYLDTVFTLAKVTDAHSHVIARGPSAFDPDSAAIAARRVMFGRLDELAHLRETFAFETTLAGRSHHGCGT